VQTLQLGENRALSAIHYNGLDNTFMVRIHVPVTADSVDGRVMYRPIEVAIHLTTIERDKLIHLLGGTPPALATPPGPSVTVVSRTQGK
jgi:hypothetical protein